MNQHIEMITKILDKQEIWHWELLTTEVLLRKQIDETQRKVDIFNRFEIDIQYLQSNVVDPIDKTLIEYETKLWQLLN